MKKAVEKTVDECFLQGLGVLYSILLSIIHLRKLSDVGRTVNRITVLMSTVFQSETVVKKKKRSRRRASSIDNVTCVSGWSLPEVVPGNQNMEGCCITECCS